MKFAYNYLTATILASIILNARIPIHAIINSEGQEIVASSIDLVFDSEQNVDYFTLESNTDFLDRFGIVSNVCISLIRVEKLELLNKLIFSQIKESIPVTETVLRKSVSLRMKPQFLTPRKKMEVEKTNPDQVENVTKQDVEKKGNETTEGLDIEHQQKEKEPQKTDPDKEKVIEEQKTFLDKENQQEVKTIPVKVDSDKGKQQEKKATDIQDTQPYFLLQLASTKELGKSVTLKIFCLENCKNINLFNQLKTKISRKLTELISKLSQFLSPLIQNKIDSMASPRADKSLSPRVKFEPSIMPSSPRQNKNTVADNRKSKPNPRSSVKLPNLLLPTFKSNSKKPSTPTLDTDEVIKELTDIKDNQRKRLEELIDLGIGVYDKGILMAFLDQETTYKKQAVQYLIDLETERKEQQEEKEEWESDMKILEGIRDFSSYPTGKETLKRYYLNELNKRVDVINAAGF
jgi:hypothetical protein